MYLIEFTLFLSFLTHIYATFGRSLAEKNPHLSTTSVGSFQLNPSYRRDKSRFRGMKSLRDEIRLRREIRTDLISSALADFIRACSDFIALARFH